MRNTPLIEFDLAALDEFVIPVELAFANPMILAGAADQQLLEEFLREFQEDGFPGEVLEMRAVDEHGRSS